MKFIKALLVAVAITVTAQVVNAEQDSFDIAVQAKTHGAVDLLVIVMGKQTGLRSGKARRLVEVAQVLKQDLSFTDQFKVTLTHVDKVPTKQEMENFYTQGYQLAIFLSNTSDKKSIEWRLYDLATESMLKGKKYHKQGDVIRCWGHAIADHVWPELTGQQGFFSTKIAYCKDIKAPKAKAIKHIFVADYDGSNEQKLVATPTVNIAPRWNRDVQNPLLFYSENTNKNVRLMVVGMDKKRSIVANFDGLNMLPSFSHDGKRAVFCASRGGGSCDLYYYEQGTLRRLTNNGGNNIAPTFSQDGQHIFFCSDYQDGHPHIYCYDFATKNIERITESGYCACPSYCATNKSLAYTKMLRGTMQIFVYNTVTKKHVQITSDAGNKEECSWSPCGNYLMFAVEHGLQSRVVMVNVHTHKKNFITAAQDICSYPSWSSSYEQLPVVTG